MKQKSENGYYCPACGKSTTEVIATMPFPKHITRKRKCLLCGHTHETCEIYTDSYKVLEFASRINEIV